MSLAATVILQPLGQAEKAMQVTKRSQLASGEPGWMSCGQPIGPIDDTTLKVKALQKKIKERYKTVAYDEVEPKEKSGKEIGRRKSRSGSNQPKPLSIKFQSSNEQRPAPKKVKRKTKKKEIAKPDIPMPSFDSPAMETRSRTIDSTSPAMSTTSKRRLSL
ncbi:hypothetical protein U9M48_000328 [Paspalum notatum var. saurae]|uniref:Uncharacterized protein n=1 Tax=Paspalum notatum var. saurae TaxID=547442 RepID=A0AAQ3PGU9_PASNO